MMHVLLGAVELTGCLAFTLDTFAGNCVLTKEIRDNADNADYQAGNLDGLSRDSDGAWDDPPLFNL